MAKTVKITSKGQVTIPKKIREVLASDMLEFEIIGSNVVVKPVKSVYGFLSKYAKKYVPLKDVRETVWKLVVHARNRKKTT